MNFEHLRLQTFDEWPPDTAVSPTRIAKAGFFSIKQELVVECFACGIRISEWNYGDQVMAKHRMLNPECPFVIDPSTSGNVPKITLQNESDFDVSPLSLKTEAARLQTFINWPVPDIVSPESLARAGFYSLRDRDKTKCAYCGGVVGSWEQGDDPDREHKRHFPHCSFVQQTITPRLESIETPDSPNQTTEKPTTFSNFNLVTGDNLDELGIFTHTAPKRPMYATYESRFNTFTGWFPNLIQTPEMLAQAGFYYEGRGDLVRCFHCDGGLRHWDPHDDPWTEHAKWFPKCSFVQLIKGQEFINACAVEQQEHDNLGGNQKLERSQPRQQPLEITDRDLQSYLMSEPALAAAGIGLNIGRIQQAIREKLQKTGVGFASADALIEATLNLQHEEEGAETSSQLSDQVSRILGVILEESHHDKPSTTKSPPVVESVKKPENEGGDTKGVSLEEENRLLKEARLCKICMDSEVGIVFLPCGHLATCVNCAPNLQDCPVCRSSIKATVRTFLS